MTSQSVAFRTCQCLLAAWLACLQGCTRRPDASAVPPQTYDVQGQIREVEPDARRMVIRHEEIKDYMGAMTMPFRLGPEVQASEWKTGDTIRFRLCVTEEESWIENLELIARPAPSPDAPAPSSLEPVPGSSPPEAPEAGVHPLRSHSFTNELGNAMTLEGLRGRALAITFFFTRCPLPDYCPRLTRNFEEASAQLAADAARGGSTNYHFISVTIDPEFDTPEVLRRYAEQHGYDPGHWSFWTGSPRWLEAFMTQSGVSLGPDGNIFNHGLRTLIVDPAGRLVVNIPMGGDLSEAIVNAMRQAMK